MSSEGLRESAVVHKLVKEMQLIAQQIEGLDRTAVDQCQYQESVLADLSSLTEEAAEVTPRFMSLRESPKLFNEKDYTGSSDGFILCMRALTHITSQFSRNFDLEQQIITSFKAALSRGSALQLRAERPRLEEESSLSELKYLYEQEVKKVGRLTDKLNNIQDEFKELQILVDELTDERERLQGELAGQTDPDLSSIKKQLQELESSMRRECSKCGRRKEKLVAAHEQLSLQSEELTALNTNLALADQRIEFL
jgi:chromosome segregation ATPase